MKLVRVAFFYCVLTPFLLAGCAHSGSTQTSASDQSVPPTTRTYYIAADEVDWNYVPSGINQISGKPFTMMERAYTANSPHRIGPIYRKAIYREYTDATFTKLKPRPADQQYLGILGPILHAQVGDTIKIVFKNNASRPYSMHAHGVFYNKDSEGVAYNDGDPHDVSQAVLPGKTLTYEWDVPERAGPGPNDPSSIMWLYHSHVDEQKDVDSGLVGAIIVTARGMANADGTPKGVDHEFVELFNYFDENQSWYIKENIARFAPAVKQTERGQAFPLDTEGFFTLNGSGFVDGNFKGAINGYLYGNGPMMSMRKGEHVRWYLATIGMGFNFHTPHWHGNTVLNNGQRTDVVALSPAQMVTVDMVPDNPGVWLFHCHVSDHMDGGMIALYRVDD